MIALGPAPAPAESVDSAPVPGFSGLRALGPEKPGKGPNYSGGSKKPRNRRKCKCTRAYVWKSGVCSICWKEREQALKAERQQRRAERVAERDLKLHAAEGQPFCDWRRRVGRTMQVRVRAGHPAGHPKTLRWISEARLVFFEQNGTGPHPCCRCGANVSLVWGSGATIGRRDEDSSNDEIGNLVLCCGPCWERRRDAERRSDHDSGRY